MRKTYILDTSVLIDDPGAYKNFTNSDIIIPIVVVNELDRKKVSPGEVGRNARVCCRLLDQISNLGDISVGVLLDNDIMLKIDVTHYDLNEDSLKGFGDPSYADTRILVCAYKECLSNPTHDVTLVSNDVNLRIKAKARGVDAIAHEGPKCSLSDLYTGIKIIKDETLGLELQKQGTINPKDFGLEFNPNECVYFEDSNGGGIALARQIAEDKLKLIKKVYPWNISSRNKEQSFAIDLIMDKNVNLVTLIGKAGTGKSLVVLASALELILNKREYEKFIIYRPIQPVGNDIGYIPGTIQEKLAPWFQAIMDNFETLFQSKSADWRRDLEMYQKKRRIEMEAITYIRGRSIPNAIILLDECFPYEQNIETSIGKKRVGLLHDMWKSNKKLPLVKTYNEQTNQFEYKQITHAWNRGEKELVQITCGNRKIKCTENHKFLTENGWKEAISLNKGDFIKTTLPNNNQLLLSLNDDQLQIVLGSFLGGDIISNHGLNRYKLQILNKEHKDYREWKAFMLNAKSSNDNSYHTAIFGLSNDLPKTTCPQWVLDKLDARGLAVLFMDNGNILDNSNVTIFVNSFDEDSNKRIVEKFNSMGIKCKFCKSNETSEILLEESGYLKLCEIISPYVYYKLKNNSNKEGYTWNNKFNNYGLTVVDNVEKLNKTECVYDLEIEDNHNFIVCSTSHKALGGLIAHNCQNLTKEEVKTVLTRAGENTKIILTGDIEQIDKSVLDATSNGLTYVIEKFKSSELAGHITFTQGERSKLATLSSEIL